jgi:hypothetical protein
MSKHASSGEETSLLSEAEKSELMDTLQETVGELQKENDRLESMKNDNEKIFGS